MLTATGSHQNPSPSPLPTSVSSHNLQLVLNESKEGLPEMFKLTFRSFRPTINWLNLLSIETCLIFSHISSEINIPVIQVDN